jgi:hypothetical protein
MLMFNLKFKAVESEIQNVKKVEKNYFNGMLPIDAMAVKETVSVYFRIIATH